MCTPYEPYKLYATGYWYGSSGTNYTADIESQTEKQQIVKEIRTNIPKRALMLEKASSDISSLPQLLPVLRKETVEYKGGIELSLLGHESTTSGFWSWCKIL